LVLSCVVTALLCATPPAAPAQQSVADGFPPEILSPALAILGTTNIDMSRLDTGDVNEDGLPDLVAYDWFSLESGPYSIALYLGTPGGDLSPPVLFEVPAEFPFIFVHPFLLDVDADGDLDILGVHRAGGATHVLLGHGDGSFDAPVLSGGGLSEGGTEYMDVGDVDGDGFPDIVFGQGFFDPDPTIEWARGLGDGTFDPATALVTGRVPRAVLLSDLDADGITDLAFMDAISATQAFVVVHLGLGGGAFAPGTAYPVGKDNSGGLLAADADGDGDLDLYNHTDDPPFNFDGGVRILHGAGDGTFEFGFFVPMANVAPASFEVADLDHDGVPDLIGKGGPLKLRRMGLGGPIGPILQVAVPADSTDDPDIAVDDLDDDGLADLVVMMKSHPIRLLNALEPFIDLGYGQSSGFGTPTITITGTPAAGQPITFGIQIGASLPGLLFIGSSSALTPFHGGVLVPATDIVLPVLGGTSFPASWPTTILPGTAIHVQAVLATGGGGTVNSNAVVMIAE
jgi:hypothetical protein